MLKILPVASGSTGNSMLVELDGKRVLIDLGVTASRLFSALSSNDYGWEDIDAVLITHTHTDHIKGLQVCLKRITAPVFMSSTSKNTLMLDRAMALQYEEKTEILPGLWVTTIQTSHDCPGSIGFKIETKSTCFGYITDLGIIPNSTKELLYGSDCIVIESNYDEEMLRLGPYPIYLKRRILSERGHLSNTACAEAVIQFAEKGTKFFFLAHLSQENNRPELALSRVREAVVGENVHIEVLPVSGNHMIEIKKRTAFTTKKITYIREPTDLQCGQAVLAMVTGVSVEQVIRELGNDRETNLKEMKFFLRKHGIWVSDERIQASSREELPALCMLSLETPRCWHWSLYGGGIFYDPEHGVLFDFPESARRYFWEIRL